MVQNNPIFDTPEAYLAHVQPDEPIHFFAPSVLTDRARLFLRGFPGMVTFAVKANPDPATLAHLLTAGLHGFDVASPREIASVRALCPSCALHYNNPVRSTQEIAFALDHKVRSFSCDTAGELRKLAALAPTGQTEVSIRFALPVSGAAYNFGSKFGAAPDDAADLLQAAARLGFHPSLTFHPGTQCDDDNAYSTYILAAAKIARRAGVTIERLNVGGGFPSIRDSGDLDLNRYFETIDTAVRSAFSVPPDLVCEPGRGMVGDAYVLAAQVKSIRDGAVYLNDGIYGGLSEFPHMGASTFRVIGPDGAPRRDRSRTAKVFGPTCDSLDVLPGLADLPGDLREGDYLVFSSMGAYVTGVSTDFNGYGQRITVPVKSLYPRTAATSGTTSGARVPGASTALS